MTKKDNDPVLVVLQLSGGNDYLNTVIPYTDPNYYDNRPALGIRQESVLKLDEELGLLPAMGPMKEIYDRGSMAIIHGIGYENSVRSHFRSMDIWHTCDPDRVAAEGWLGRVTRDIDPEGENPITAVNIGHGLPRALAAPGVAVASVADLSTFGLLTGVEREAQRDSMLQRFAKIYGPAIGRGPVQDYLAQAGLSALGASDILKSAHGQYASSVEYGDSRVARSLRDVATIHTSGLGTRVFYTQYGSFDTHAVQATDHARLWSEVSGAIADFWDDLKEHDADENVIMFLFSEFGRRVRDNGSGTDHGAAGVAFAIGPRVRGGMYGMYPETRASALEQGDMVANQDFRGVYSTIVEDWFGLDAAPIVNGRFERPAFV